MRRRLAAAAALTLGLSGLVLAEPRRGRAADPDRFEHGAGPSVAVSSDAHVPEGQVHQGEMVVIFGDARVEGTVTGEVVVILGSLDLSGTVEGDVVSILSRTRIADTAHIGGELVNVGWSMDRSPASRVAGDIVNVNFMRFIPFSGQGGGWSGLMRLLFIIKLVKLGVVFLGVLLVTALVPRRLSVIASAFPGRWGWALLAGILAYAGLVVASVLLAVTIIGIPLAIALGFAMMVIKWMGVASLLYLTGSTAGRNLFGRELSHLAAVLGGFAVYALVFLIPFVGPTATGLVSLLGVGIAVLTRFGTEEGWRARAASAPPEAAPTI
jgi:hypothetical protein